MKTVHRYVLTEMLPPFLLCVSVLTFLFMINKASLLMDLVINKKVPVLDTLVLYLSLMPFILSVTIPMSMMVATLLAFGRLSSDMEVTALKSSGVHLFQLIGPVLLLGAFMAGFMLFFNAQVLPAANFAFKKLHFQILQRQANIALRERVWISQFEGYQFYIDQQDREGLFSNVIVKSRWSPQASAQITFSKQGHLETDSKNYQVFFHLNDGVMTWDNNDYHTYNRLYFDHYTIHLKLESQLAHLADVKKDFEEMTNQEIQDEIATTTDPGRRNSLRTEFQKRLALPFACLVFVWFCAPIGLWMKAKGFMGFAVGIVLILVYYPLFTLGQVFSERGVVSPWLGLWGANVLLALAGCFIYYIVVMENSAFRPHHPHVVRRRKRT